MVIAALTILFILLLVIVALLTFARNLLLSIIDTIVGLFRRGDSMNRRNEGRQTIRKRTRNKKKVYSDSDGEYVDFEEIKK